MIDWTARANDIRKLVRAHPAFQRAVQLGHDAEDLHQEVWVTLLARDRGKTPWNPARASWTKWVHLVTGSAVTHFLSRMGTRGRHEQVGVRGEESPLDAAAYAEAHLELDLADDERAAILATLGPDEHHIVARYLVLGHTVAQARQRFGAEWDLEVTRIAGRVREALLGPAGPEWAQGGERDKA
jgi:DNA-directed RNA polymerase specialized sigma24 family protein